MSHKRHLLYRLLRDKGPIPFFTTEDVVELWREETGEEVKFRTMQAMVIRLVDDKLLQRLVRGVYGVRTDAQQEALRLPEVRESYANQRHDPGRKAPLEMQRRRQQ